MEKMITIVHGSNLYGTNTPSSDLDIKGVYIPSAEDILLGKIQKSKSFHTKKDNRSGLQERNNASDLDQEFYSLCKYISLFQEGQTVALEIMFSTPLLERGKHYNEEWFYLWQNRDKLMSKKADCFLGYAYKQASKYGIKGSRVAAIRNVVEVLTSIGNHNNQWHDKLEKHHLVLEVLIRDVEHSSIEVINNNGKEIKHLEVCGRKAPYTIKIVEAYKIYKKILDEYGQRALQAENNDNVDWKALSHAVRVGTQSIEYLSTGFVTFPRPDRQHLLDIKQGNVVYQEVAEEIEQLLEQVKEAAEKSELPDKPNYEWCEEYLKNSYRAKIFKEYEQEFREEFPDLWVDSKSVS